MGLELDCGLFLVFRTSWLLWSQTSLSKLVKTVLCHITEVFLCERAPSFTVVRPCYDGSTKARLVCYTGVNSQSDCVVLEQLPVKFWHWAGFHSRLPPRGYQHCLCSGKDLAWPRQWDWGQKVACISLYSTSILQESGTVPQNQCIGFN